MVQNYFRNLSKLWCNCCLSGIIRFCHSRTTEDVTVVPWALSHPFHSHGKTVSSAVEQVWQYLLSQLCQEECTKTAKRDAPRQPRGIHQDSSSQPYYANIGCLGEIWMQYMRFFILFIIISIKYCFFEPFFSVIKA